MLDLITSIFKKKKVQCIFKEGDIVVEKDDPQSFYEFIKPIDKQTIIVSFLGHGWRRPSSPVLHFRDKASNFRLATKGEIHVFNNVRLPGKPGDKTVPG